MSGFRKSLPPLHCLMVFEAAARANNFSKASKELNVTQAAVSKQVKFLEEYLGITLFDRRGKRIHLTEKGRRLYERISSSLEFISQGIQEVALIPDENRITVTANLAVSHYWLNPMFRKFAQDNPNTELHMKSVDVPGDQLRDTVDLAILYSDGHRPNWKMIELFPEVLFPVASPAYIETHGYLADDLSNAEGHIFLDFERQGPDWINWPSWRAAMSLNPASPKAIYTYNNYALLIDTAIRGGGVALGSQHLIQNSLDSGDLVRMGESALTSERGYYLAAPRGRPLSSIAARFQDFLQSHAILREESS